MLAVFEKPPFHRPYGDDELTLYVLLWGWGQVLREIVGSQGGVDLWAVRERASLR